MTSLEWLLADIGRHESAIVALSGGVDSATVARVRHGIAKTSLTPTTMAWRDGMERVRRGPEAKSRSHGTMRLSGTRIVKLLITYRPSPSIRPENSRVTTFFGEGTASQAAGQGRRESRTDALERGHGGKRADCR